MFKPASMLTQADKTGDVSLFDEVKQYLKEKYKKPGNVFLGLLHRLDRPVSGIVLFAKTSKGASRLSEQFRNHTIQKIYHAIVVGKPKKGRGILINSLQKNETEKSKIAELAYEVLESNGEYSLLKITPKTGRFHQIRIQLEKLGNPILRLPDRSIALCATRLSFQLATKPETKTISIPLPKEWQKYLTGVASYSINKLAS